MFSVAKENVSGIPDLFGRIRENSETADAVLNRPRKDKNEKPKTTIQKIKKFLWGGLIAGFLGAGTALAYGLFSGGDFFTDIKPALYLFSFGATTGVVMALMQFVFRSHTSSAILFYSSVGGLAGGLVVGLFADSGISPALFALGGAFIVPLLFLVDSRNVT